jgi:hypothetical protein
MFGTITRLQVKPGMLGELRKRSDQIAADVAGTGMVFEHIYQSPDNENELWLVVAFESREAYRRNAESPEQHQRYLQLRELLEADPEWHDGEVIQSYPK